jgi:hypothetical protein
VPRGDGDVERGAGGAVPQADEAARAGEGGEVGRHGGMAEGAGCVKARAVVARHEEKRLPARLDQRLGNLKMPFVARDIEAGASVNGCLEKKRLPSRLDQSLRNLEIPFVARDIEAGASVLFCLEKKRLPARLDQNLGNLKMPL